MHYHERQVCKNKDICMTINWPFNNMSYFTEDTLKQYPVYIFSKFNFISLVVAKVLYNLKHLTVCASLTAKASCPNYIILHIK